MTGVEGQAMWRGEFCGVENEIGSDVLTVHHLDDNKWNLSRTMESLDGAS